MNLRGVIWFAAGFMSAHLGLWGADKIDGHQIMAGLMTLILALPLVLVAWFVVRKIT